MSRLALIFLALLFALPGRAAAMPEVREVVSCSNISNVPPDFTGATCRRIPVGSIDPQRRQVWVKAIIDLPSASDEPLAVRVAAMAASEVWWNGTRLGANGRPGARASTEIPGRLDAVWPIPPALLRPGQNILVLRLSSWHQPWRVDRPILQIDTEDYAGSLAPLLLYYLPAIPTAGTFVIAAIFFGAAWLTDRRDKGSLALAALSLFTLLQLTAEISRGILPLPYPWQAPRLALIMLCASGVGLSMLAYAVWHYRRKAMRWWMVGGTAVLLGVCALSIPADQRSQLVLALGALGSMLATGATILRRGDEGRRARILLAALAIFIILLAIQPDFLDATLYLTLAALSAILFANQILLLRRIQREATAEAARAAGLEMALLRQSIAPHFLLNTLNSMIEWVESNPRAGVRMIELLGDEFRTLSRIAGQPLIALQEEIDLCRSHLQLMAFRTDARLSFAVEGEVSALRVPPGVILTLVENALVHGRYVDGDSFLLKVVRFDDVLVTLELTTPPSLHEGAGSLGTGTGLTYVGTQIAAAFGNAATVNAEATAGNGWCTTIVTGAV
ncbi:sensor histidine kinase [Sphingomonas sp. AP4-R1]|uniref:sensor histidine kinase n=1 Tax=Sphingomonas sp. AP4-R1 TaxID=2735134 RepID=UPI001493C3A3|nr:sensor histidine kinase [Sphingomonas sp. AP4-R1]QJU58232.1 sensor histidine kinase [Sphingomonas sp. AP4-R1]